jgi:hypothetical protein
VIVAIDLNDRPTENVLSSRGRSCEQVREVGGVRFEFPAHVAPDLNRLGVLEERPGPLLVRRPDASVGVSCPRPPLAIAIGKTRSWTHPR